MKVAQTQLEADFSKNVANITVAAPTTDNDKWDGNLIIEGYHNLTNIDLAGHSIDGLVIRDCPKLIELDLNNNDTKKVDLSKLTLDLSKNPIANTTLINFWANNNHNLTKINLKNCTKIEKLALKNCGTIEEFLGGEDFDASLKDVAYEGTNGLSFAGTSHLKELKGAKEAVDVILGGEKPKKRRDPVTGEELIEIDVDALKNQLIVKGSENPSSPIKNELGAIKAELGLGKNAAQSQIIAKIRELMGPGYISKVSLTSDAEDSLKGLGVAEGEISKLSVATSARDVEISRNKLVNDKFNELQSKLNHAHYINIGLGTLSVGVLLILTWMILKDRKLLPSQEDEEVKD